MAITQTYVDYGAGSDVTGDGTIGAPWKTLQYAFDHLTRNTTDGNQVNLKAGTAHVNAAALDLTTFVAGGALAGAAPLILRGYTSAANDGGGGEIDCGGATMFAATTYDHLALADLDMHTFGNNTGVQIYRYGTLFHCKIHKGASSPSGKALVYSGVGCRYIGNYVYDAGAGAANGIQTGSSCYFISNYIALGASASSGEPYGINAYQGGCLYLFNIVLCGHAAQQAIWFAANDLHYGNLLYNTAASTLSGARAYGTTSVNISMQNIVCGWSGVGGEAISADANVGFLGYNAFYNNTAAYTLADQVHLDLRANDVALAADPFTNAAAGDFSLTAAAKTALAAKGFPLAYLGAHANTVPNLNIGPIQMAASSGGGGVNMPRVRVGH